MRRYTFSLPLPPRETSKNSHQHWLANRRASAPYMDEVRLRLRNMRALGALPATFPPPVTIHFEFYLKPDKSLSTLNPSTGRRRSFYRPRDEDNARGAAWPVPDSLVLEGFLPDDRSCYVSVGTTTLHPLRQYQGKSCLLVHVDCELDALES